MNSNFEGKTAVVTGGGSGIGRALALTLAARGATVVALDVDGAGLEQTVGLASSSGAEITSHVVDVSDKAAVDSVLTEAGSVLDTVDILCNVAGVMSVGPLIESTTDELTRLMKINVGSVVTMVGALATRIPYGGVIINTASSTAQRTAFGTGLYGASKAAIVYLTRALANELRAQGVRVCAVAPGSVDTPMPRKAAAGLPDIDAAIAEYVKTSQIIARQASPEEIAAAFCYLASPDGGYYTGSTLWIDGGNTTLD